MIDPKKYTATKGKKITKQQADYPEAAHIIIAYPAFDPETGKKVDLVESLSLEEWETMRDLVHAVEAK